MVMTLDSKVEVYTNTLKTLSRPMLRHYDQVSRFLRALLLINAMCFGL